MMWILMVWLIVTCLLYAKYKSEGALSAALWPAWAVGLGVERIAMSLNAPRRKRQPTVERWS
jgi:hypothetical protein